MSRSSNISLLVFLFLGLSLLPFILCRASSEVKPVFSDQDQLALQGELASKIDEDHSAALEELKNEVIQIGVDRNLPNLLSVLPFSVTEYSEHLFQRVLEFYDLVTASQERWNKFWSFYIDQCVPDRDGKDCRAFMTISFGDVDVQSVNKPESCFLYGTYTSGLVVDHKDFSGHTVGYSFVQKIMTTRHFDAEVFFNFIDHREPGEHLLRWGTEMVPSKTAPPKEAP